MASTYSTNLKIELMGTGDQVGSWGTTTNNNFQYALEEAIVGYGAVQFTNDANLTISLSSSNSSQTARKLFLYVTSTVTLTQQRDLIVPTIEKTYTVHNNTTGSQAIRVKTSAGTGIVVPSGKKMILYVDGTNVIEQMDYATALDIGTLNITTPLPVASGGTGSATASGARTNLGLGTIATQAANNVAITGGSITGITDLAIADGGTGASTANAAINNLLPSQTGNNGKYLKSDGTNTAWDAIDISTADITGTLPIANGGTDATTAGAARTNLGLGSISTQDASNVSITGGSISGITDLAIADGGTGSSTASGARTNLGLGTIATQAASSIAITGGSITGITDLAIADGGTGASDAGTARTNLGLGTIATQAANNVAITGGSITGITDLAIADGGTGASTASGARTNLDVPSTTGSGASGTWGISVSGNAATVTNGVYTTNFTGTNQSLSATSGYQKLPGGLILQWIKHTTDSTGYATLNWPIAFPTACLNAQVTVGPGAAESNAWDALLISYSATQVRFGYYSNTTYSVFAVGY